MSEARAGGAGASDTPPEVMVGLRMLSTMSMKIMWLAGVIGEHVDDGDFMVTVTDVE